MEAPELIDVGAARGIEGLRWIPVVGAETTALLAHLRLTPEGSDQLLREAVRVLGRSLSPVQPEGRETGLVIGYVQSGKTMSFTAVAALARDNGYRLIIVCTGLTVPLFSQSQERLERDLRLNDRDDRHWLFLPNPTSNAHTRQTVVAALEGDDDDLPGLPRKTVLIAVMKNRTHLDNLAQLVTGLNLRGQPALIIDDEADQASLNNDVRRRGESATYRRITSLRRSLPHTTFLQYTATPQALLLVNLIDVLSPGFAEVLTPGSTYSGGEAFFRDERLLIRRIPAGDIPSVNNPLRAPPESLIEAMRIFFLGVAAGTLEGEHGNRSMMVHPSQRRLPHGDYATWVRQIQANWARVLALGAADPDYIELIDEFAMAHQELRRTVPDLLPLEDLIPALKRAIRRTVVTVMNAAGGRTPQPDWRQTYSNIVVGGEVLNRGFTVQGLTVTYMPRGLGTRQADTIQQRARWFGYRDDYLGYCRVFLSNAAVDAYQAYLEHEEDLRRQIRDHQRSGRDLREWRRAFFLDARLRPTRNSVIDVDLQRGNFSDDWYSPHAPHDEGAVTANRRIVEEFVRNIRPRLHQDEGHARRTAATIHQVARGIALRDVHRDVLTRLRATRACDAPPFAGLLLQVARYLENHPDATCTVFVMSAIDRGTRTTGADDEIPNLFQGANYDRTKTPPEETYPGDREIHADGELTIQVHDLEVISEGVTQAHVPAIAVWVPAAMAKDWVAQPQ